MIAEIRFKNMFSFRDEAILSFEADRSKDMESYHVVELGGGVRLLKVAVIYGANASGKSNIIKVCDFIKSFITYTPLNKAEQIQIVPFLLNKTSSRHLSEYSISFYLKNKEKTVKKAKSENATCYIDGIKQDSAFDPDGLNIYDYDISYKNNRLYFKTIKKSEYTSSMNNGSGWYFPLYFPVFR